ncbi:hypothetical protein LCGC14_1922050 [marine sediment metagenome]|uniref:Uncharacterized protein n=1 Tax=marine sediment metagenome TaxID=412755 RepID=A0A0F9FQ93_9ZZZZ
MVNNILIFVGGGLNLKYSPDLQLNVLESYWTLKSRRELKIEKPFVKSFFLDSGAFSAWSRGATIDLDRYIGFIKRFKDKINIYANLDNITDIKETEANQKTMEDAGLQPLPVFHHGEPFEILDKLLSEYTYVALGGMVPVPTVKLDPWLTLCFERICNDDGTAARKIHGFGLTTISLIKKFPFYSVDSVSPVLTGVIILFITALIFNNLTQYRSYPTNTRLTRIFKLRKQSTKPSRET